MLKILKKITIKENLLVLFFVLIVLGDALTKIIYDRTSTLITPSKIIKAVLLIPLLLLSFNNNKLFVKYLFVAFILFIVGCISISNSRILENLPQFFEYYFYILFFVSFKDVKLQKAYKYLEVIFIVHALIIILSFIFEIQFFKTYTGSNRLGFMSLFNSQNEFSYVIMAGIFLFTTTFKRVELSSYLKLLLIIIAGFLTGTKAIILYILLFGIYILFTKTKPKFYISFITVTITVILVFKENMINFFIKNYYSLYSLYQKEGFLSFLSSTRDILLIKRYNKNVDELSIMNYLFGGYNLSNKYEMSLFDIFSFFGILGTAFYILIALKFFIKHIYFNNILIAYLFMISTISFVAGYLFENASAQIYSLLVIMMISYFNEKDSFDLERKKQVVKTKK